MEKVKVIGLFGSMRFKKLFLRLEREYTLKGYLVLMPFLDGMYHKKRYSTKQWESLMSQAYRRIELSDIVFIVNKDGYLGYHTLLEVQFAKSLNKEVQFLETEEL